MMGTNTTARKQHLTDLEFSDLLADSFPGSGAEAHLASCEFCQRELEAVQFSLGNFRSFGTAWAQVEAPRRVPVPSRLVRHLGLRPSWGAGLVAAGFGLVLALGLNLSPAHPAGQAHSAPQTTPPSTTELAKDNRLMLSISQELSAEAQPAVPTSELRTAAAQADHDLDSPVLD